MKKKLGQNQFKHYIAGFVVYIGFMMISLFVFFVFIQKEVNRDTEGTIGKYVDRQSYHFHTIMDIHFSFLEGIAGYLGQSPDILSVENMELLKSVHQESSFERMAIIDLDGSCRYDNGETANVKERDYFQKALEGERCISDPIESKVDQHNRVVLCVPVYREEQVAGMVCGSYNLSGLTYMLFEDIYDGLGYCSIITKEGRVISIDVENQEGIAWENENFFDYYGALEYGGSKNAEDMRRDFLTQSSGCVRIRRGEDSRFMAYEPLDINGWMLCYVVPVDVAKESYSFINDYESILVGVLAIGVLLLVLYILKINSRKEKVLIHYAETDALTGCRNKQSTEDLINERLKKGAYPLNAFLMMDVDKFKGINDIYGHAVGDEVLHAVGRRICASFREQDIVGRIGGDEFVVYLENVATKENAVARVERLRESLLGMRFPSMDGGGITVSMGMAFAPEQGGSFEEIYVKADEALYETKRRGRNGLTVCGGQKRMEGSYDIAEDFE